MNRSGVIKVTVLAVVVDDAPLRRELERVVRLPVATQCEIMNSVSLQRGSALSYTAMVAFSSFADPSILLATLGREAGARASVRSIIGTWDMINVDVPSLEMIETAAGALQLAGLVTIDDDWIIRPTAAGARIRRAPRGVSMRELPSALRDFLPPLTPDPAVLLPPEIYEEALADYLRPRPPLLVMLWQELCRR